MEEIKLKSIIPNADKEIIDLINNYNKESKNSKKGILKVTTEVFYNLYEHSQEDLEKLAKEWFDEFAGKPHAYRDGSKFITNIIKIERI